MTSAHQWRFYLSPREAWEAMYRDCEEAAESIELEEYILENDPVGRRFLELFIKKAASGVKVFVLCDRYGSASFSGSELVQKLRAGGGHFYFYNRIHLSDIFRPRRWFPRTHIKTLLVDSRIAYTGGVCIAARMKDWRDTQIRITGPVVAQIKDAFSHTDQILKKTRLSREMKKQDCGGEFFYLQSNPLLSRHAIYAELVQAINQAKDYVYLTTPFFAPNRRFRRLLARAVSRGVKVVLLLPIHSDISVADWMALSYAGKLLDGGLRIFRYTETIIHCKTVIIDDVWATIGSTNIDVLSFFHNREANLVTRNADAVMALKQQFLADLEHSVELTCEQLAREPRIKLLIGRMARGLKHFLR